MKSKYILFIVLVMTLTLPFSSCSGNGSAALLSTASTDSTEISNVPENITNRSEKNTVTDGTGPSVTKTGTAAVQTVTVTFSESEESCTVSQAQATESSTTVPQKSTEKVTLFTLGTTTESKSKATANTTREQVTSAITTAHSLTDARTVTETKQSISVTSSTPKTIKVTGTEEQKSVSVTVTLSCRAAVEYAESNPGKSLKIPFNENGIVFSSPVTVSAGDSAMSALKKVLSEKGLAINESRGYIRGIGGLNEKDCGGSSGWMYTVNGDAPMTASDKYTVSPGDRIIFYYVTKYGDTP